MIILDLNWIDFGWNMIFLSEEGPAEGWYIYKIEIASLLLDVQENIWARFSLGSQLVTKI